MIDSGKDYKIKPKNITKGKTLNTYQLTWKPDEWGYEGLKERINAFVAGETTQRWSCGNSKSISIGSRVPLMNQGKGKGSIFGSGNIVREPFEDEHYNHEKRAAGKSCFVYNGRIRSTL